MKFLNRVAQLVIDENNGNFEKVTVIFPSIRAGLFFKQELGKLMNKSFFAPEVYSIEQFASKTSNIFPAERLKLIFELFKVYKEHFGNETFDNFYNWGSVLLKDFDDIDKNLVDTEKFFRIIKEYKEIDENYSPGLDDYESYKSFWESFSNEPISEFKQSFSELWEKLNSIYNSFTQNLCHNKTGYNGLIFREAVSVISKEDYNSGYDKIYFAGFNYITKSEQSIMLLLAKRENATLLWNADDYYINEIPGHEAGRLLQKNFKTFDEKEIKWITKSFEDEKDISVYSAGSKVAQAKAVSKILNSIDKPGINTAIVLPDDSMLFPVLNSLPENVSRVNVSMGYPLKLSSFHSLIEAYIRLHSNKRIDSSGVMFYYKDVFRILSSRIIVPFYGTSSKIISDFKYNVTKQRLIYIKQSELPKGIEILEKNFKSVQSVTDIFENIEGIITSILSSDEHIVSDFELEFISNYLQFLRQLRGVISEYGTEVDLKTFWKLYMDVIRESRLPFKGEPLEGLQILGLLETRNLSFDNVIMISMNEKIIPGNRFSESFIPFNLKKSFGISTFEDFHDSTANYFYNIIKDAKNIHLIYSSDTSDMGDGEESRYITQLELELPKVNLDAKIKKFAVTFPEGNPGETNISVKKNASMFDKFTRGVKSLSPSALNSYVNCSLKFYFAYILGLREQEEPTENIDAKTTGNILHYVMKNLYDDHKGKEIDASLIDSLLNKSDDIVEEAMKNEPHYIIDHNIGANLITKKIIQGLVKRLLQLDKKYIPFKIIALETEDNIYKIEVESKNGKVFIGGKIDRIDEKDGITRIVDYKTGVVDKFDLEKTDLSEIFSDPKYKEALQTFVYAYMYMKSTGASDIRATMLGLKNKNGIVNDVIKEKLTDEELKKFEGGLRELVAEILNDKIPFEQAEDEKRCAYCPYISICGR